MFPLTTASAGSPPSSGAKSAEIRKKKIMKLFLCLALEHQPYITLKCRAMCPAALQDGSRSVPTAHVRVGAIELSVPLHYLLLPPPAAASMDQL